MKFSLKVEYGLRALLELAEANGNRPIGTREIALRQGIPERFLEQQITALKNAGLIISLRGAQGGCILAKEAQEISVLEVVEALDGPVLNQDCLSVKEHSCQQFAQCVIQEIWLNSQLKLKNYLASVTIADLVARQQQLEAGSQLGLENNRATGILTKERSNS